MNESKQTKILIIMDMIETLKQENNSLKSRLSTMEGELLLFKNKYNQSVEAYAQLLHAFKQSQRRQFGESSERFIDQSPAQGDFFSDIQATPNSLETEVTPDDQSNPAKSSRKLRKPRQKKSGHFLKSLLRREVIIPVDNKDENATVIRYEITELLHYIPPVYEVIVQKREVVTFKNSETNVIELKTAPNPKRLLPKALVTESFLAHMIVSKIYDRQPLYHLQKKYAERFDFVCPRNKMARWMIQSAQALQPLVNLFQDHVIDYDVALCDPTHLQVLNEPGRAATTESYVVTIRGGAPDKSVVLYQYNAEDHKSFLNEFFQDYQGYLQVDGQNIFDVFEGNKAISLVFCNSHSRRKFEPIDKASVNKGLANEAMKFYQALYKIERAAKNANMTPEARYQLRQEKTKPLIDKFETFCDEMTPLTLPQSPLGKAFKYVNDRRSGLRIFLEDGRLEVDTNGVERSNKDFALARNNFLFSYSVEGARALCVHASITFTAISHGLDPYHYYVYIMQKAPYCKTVEEYETLLPWNVKCIEQFKKVA